MNALLKAAASSLAALLAHAGDFEGLAEAVEAEFHTIAHGEGGVQKVKAAATGAAAIAEKVGTIAASL